jgi:hypothetical protein|tara:strand:- start:403 stop:1515 length:1113 start_codon:yes stop_codon:yes gene_type:complete
MNYKETLFFVAKCLTINHEEHNEIIIKNLLKSNAVDWDAVVKLSTAHYVFPALYCNLKRASFLAYLPEELVEYMKYITDLNRDRNKEIIEQAKELNELLLQNKITPIFLKGTGNLLEGLYEDIGERMVGDIDFIFSKKDYPKAIKLLTNNGYSSIYNKDYIFPDSRHYPRLIKYNEIAAIEIHKEILIKKYTHEFNYDFVKNSNLTINNVSVISFKNQLILSTAASQINDQGFDNKSLTLRNAYDVFILSKKTIAKNAFSVFYELENPLTCFLASCYEVFNKPETLQYFESKKIAQYLVGFNKNLCDRELAKKIAKKTRNKVFIYDRLNVIYKCFFYKAYRVWFLKTITDKNWRHEKMIQLGLKKSKSKF